MAKKLSELVLPAYREFGTPERHMWYARGREVVANRRLLLSGTSTT